MANGDIIEIFGKKHIEVTQKMTSNTEPSPYVAKAGDNVTSGRYAYAVTNTDVSALTFDTYTGWVSIDMGEEISFSCIRVSMSNYLNSYDGKNINLLASNDGIIYDTLSIQIGNSTNKGIVYFSTGLYKYRHYKVQLTGGNTVWTSIYSVRFYQEYNETPYVSHTKAFHAQTIPLNTTQKILSKTNDSREGLLGMANDDENYGDLYVVGNDGKAHLTKSGIKSEVLFEGKVSVGDIALTKSYKLFKNLIFFVTCDGFGYTEYSCVSNIIDTSIIIENYNDLNTVGQIAFAVSGGGAIETTFTSEKTLKNIRLVNNNSTISIKKIIGIY